MFEIINNLDMMFLSLLKENFKANGNYPRRIVFFRDGVSDGQFPTVTINFNLISKNLLIEKLNKKYFMPFTKFNIKLFNIFSNKIGTF